MKGDHLLTSSQHLALSISGNGTIDFSEFVVMMAKQQCLGPEELAQVTIGSCIHVVACQAGGVYRFCNIKLLQKEHHEFPELSFTVIKELPM